MRVMVSERQISNNWWHAHQRESRVVTTVRNCCCYIHTD